MVEIVPSVDQFGLSHPEPGYRRRMLYTILIVLAIIALALFILGRR